MGLIMDEEKCSICNGPLAIGSELENGWLHGNNAQPVNDGRCCETCNQTVVLPTRIRMMLDQKNESNDKQRNSPQK